MPATLNHTWGYKDDHDWKSPGEITFKLVDIVSKGGNYLLNVGPMADGVIPQASQDTLRTVGRWLQGERRGGLRRGPDALRRRAGRAERQGREGPARPAAVPGAQGMARHHQTGQAVFHLLRRSRACPFELPAMKNAVKRAYRLADNAPVETKTEGGRTILTSSRARSGSDGHRGRRGVRRRARSSGDRRGDGEALVNRRGFLGRAGRVRGRAGRPRQGRRAGGQAGAGANRGTGSERQYWVKCRRGWPIQSCKPREWDPQGPHAGGTGRRARSHRSRIWKPSAG